ncbi:MAG TPA: hypothetical protein VIQ31_31955 [Phormidium sp.]
MTGYIHSKQRNRLGQDKVRQLVYIKTNAAQLSNNETLMELDESEDESDDLL